MNDMVETGGGVECANGLDFGDRVRLCSAGYESVSGHQQRHVPNLPTSGEKPGRQYTVFWDLEVIGMEKRTSRATGGERGREQIYWRKTERLFVHHSRSNTTPPFARDVFTQGNLVHAAGTGRDTPIRSRTASSKIAHHETSLNTRDSDLHDGRKRQ